MSWQADLQQLDGALAAGQISADEYRQRRDQLLALAAGHSPQPNQPQQPQTPPVAAPPPVQPVPPQQAPFPPAFKWQDEAPQQSAAEATALIQPVAAPVAPKPDADQTQVVSGIGDAPDRTQFVAGDERTQAVNNERTQAVRPQHGQGFPAAPRPLAPWDDQHAHGAGTPWSSDELPPEFGVNPGWPRQGPEVFEESGSSGKGKLIGLIAAAVVVLAGAAALYFFVLKDNGDKTDPAPTSQTAAPTTSAGPKLPAGPFVSVPGSGKPNIGEKIPIAAAIEAKVPSEAEGKLLQAAGITDISFVVNTEGQLSRGIWVFAPAASGDPKAALAAVNKEFQDAGHQQATQKIPGVTVWVLTPNQANPLGSLRAHFIVDGKLVRVEAFGPDQTASKEAFDELLDRVVNDFPPSP